MNLSSLVVLIITRLGCPVSTQGWVALQIAMAAHETMSIRVGATGMAMSTCGRGLRKSSRPADRVESSRYSVRRIPNGVKSFQNGFPLFPTQLAKIGMQA